MNVENRAAENGSKIIDDALEHKFGTGKAPIAIRVLEDTVITALVAANVENVAYYTGRAMTTDDPVILGNFSSIKLTSGAVQAVY